MTWLPVPSPEIIPIGKALMPHNHADPEATTGVEPVYAALQAAA